MPLRLSDLATEVTKIELAFGEDVLHLEAYLKRITPALISDLDHLGQGGVAAIEHLVALLPQLIRSWDLEGEPGTAVPLTPEALRRVPLEVLSTILKGIIERMSLDPTPAAS